MDLGLRGKVAIVTGSSDGIGYGVAHALAEEGVRVVLCARRESLLAEARQAIERETGAEVFAVPCDVQRLNDVQSLVKETARRFGAIHILVNNAGSVPSIQFASVEDAQWHQMLEGKLLGYIRVTRETVPYMERAGWGRIINMGAVGAERAFGQAKISAYAAAKAAVVALSRSLALEEAKNGITVNVVNPSSIDENELTLEEARRIRDARFPIGRPPTVEDVAATVAFFASEEAEYVTGQVVNVSGGWML